jgi:hypothetical protein
MPLAKVGSAVISSVNAVLAGAALSTARVQTVASAFETSPAATPRKVTAAFTEGVDVKHAAAIEALRISFGREFMDMSK